MQYGLFLEAKSAPDFSIVPTRGATGLNELIGLFFGWGVPFILCLDDDPAGRIAVAKYTKDWSLPAKQAMTLADVDQALRDKTIEGFLDKADLQTISAHFQVTLEPSKSQIQLFFSEMLASKNTIVMSNHYKSLINAFINKINASFE